MTPTIADLEAVGMTLGPAELRAVIGDISQVHAVLVARLAELSARGPDRALSVREAARVLGIGASTLYNRRRRYPFTLPGKPVRFSSHGIQAWLAGGGRP